MRGVEGEIVPCTCHKVDVVLDLLLANVVDVGLANLVFFLWVKVKEDEDEVLDKPFLELDLCKVSHYPQSLI